MIRLALAALLGVACSSPSPAPSPPPKVTPAPAASASTRGTVAKHQVESAALGVTKNVTVYLPAGYDADPARRWPVFYYLHGLGGSEDDWVKGGELDKAADALGLAAIVVMPDGDNSFYTDSVTPMDYEACMKDGTGLFIPAQPPAETCVKTPRYEAWITKDLLAWTDAKFRTVGKREGRAIAGLSMGGFGALQLALRHKDLYVATASHSGVDALLYGGPFPYEAGKVQLIDKIAPAGGDMIVKWLVTLFGTEIANWRAHDPAALVGDLAPGQLAIYLDCGTEDFFRLNNGMQYLHELLLAKKIEHAFYLGPGRHDFSFWKPRLPESLKFLAAATSRSRPAAP